MRFKLRERLRGKEAVDPDRTDKHLVAVYLTQRQQSEEEQLKATATVEFDRYNLRRMAVGWQTVAETINATVVRFRCQVLPARNRPTRRDETDCRQAAVIASLGVASRAGNWRDIFPTRQRVRRSSDSKRLEPTPRQINQFRPSATVPFTSGITSNRPSNWQRCTRASGTRTSTP